MDENSPRENLAKLIAERGENFGALSRLLGRNAAYIQQFIRRGTPKKLDEADRRVLARYFGVDEILLGAIPERQSATHSRKKSFQSNPISFVPRLEVEASAGSGTIVPEEYGASAVGFDRRWLKRLGFDPENLSIIEVKGESMSPTLISGDTIMVDTSDSTDHLRDGIYVLRLDDALMVKRVALSPRKGGALTISSDNPHYPRWDNIERTAVDIVGRVVWSSRILA